MGRHVGSCPLVHQADALLFGRLTYEMMEAAWRPRTGARPDWVGPWMEPLGLDDRRGEEVRRVEHLGPGRLERGARARGSGEGRSAAQARVGKGLFTGGVKLPMALAELGLIDEYEFVVQPRLAATGQRCSRGYRSAST